jgi:bacillithiol system protein YtxJ
MKKVEWVPLESVEQLQDIQEESESKTVVIFKHSSRCGTSQMVLGRLERAGDILQGTKLYFLDLLRHRDVSSMIEHMFSVQHESPQLLVIRGREAVLHLSHYEIEPDVVKQSLLRS